jgi:hypothetical protein
MIFSLKRMNLAVVTEGKEAKKRLSLVVIEGRYREMPS